MRGLFQTLFDDDVLVGEIDPRQVTASQLLPGEVQLIRHAVAKRKREFTAGRVLARLLLTRLGVAPGFELLMDDDRAPRWPEGFVGSITHVERWAAVAVARTDQAISLGCDLEVDQPLAQEEWSVVCGPRELAWLEAQPRERRGRLAKLLFSAKETVYKAQYPLTRTVLEFGDVEVEIDAGGGFETMLETISGPRHRGSVLRGRWRADGGLIATAMTIRPGARTAGSLDVPE